MLAITFPAIDPVLIEFGPFAVRWYALAYIGGILLGWWYARRLVNTPGVWSKETAPLSATMIDDFILWMTLGIILGGRLGYVLFYDYGLYAHDPLGVFKLWQGGMSFHGGFLGSVAAIILFARSRSVRIWSLLDICAVATPFGLFFGRLANFINGELWGRPTSMPWGVIFPTADDAARHPSQLYEALLEGPILFLVLIFLIYRAGALMRPGLVAGTFTCGYGLARFTVEFFREPDAHIGYLFGWITMGMLLSLPMIALGLWGIMQARQNNSAPGVKRERV